MHDKLHRSIKSRIGTIFKMSNLKASNFLFFILRLLYLLEYPCLCQRKIVSNRVRLWQIEIHPSGWWKKGGKKKKREPSSLSHLRRARRIEASLAALERIEIRWRDESKSNRAEPSRAESNRASRRVAPAESMWPVTVRHWCASGCVRSTGVRTLLVPLVRIPRTRTFRKLLVLDHLYSFIAQFKDLQQPPLLSIIFVPSM